MATVVRVLKARGVAGTEAFLVDVARQVLAELDRGEPVECPFRVAA